MIISVLNTIVNNLKSGTDEFTFGYGPEWFANLDLDEATFPIVYLDQPVDNDYLLAQGGYIGEEYPVTLFFMYKSQMDYTPAELDANCIDPANLAIRQFISRCQASDLIDEISDASGTEFTHLLDVDVSGKSLTVTIKPSINASVCLQNKS
jgi:hypothetical protein